jgi:hypothetical protein
MGTTGSDAALKQWASKTPPIVQMHLERAKEIQENDTYSRGQHFVSGSTHLPGSEDLED